MFSILVPGKILRLISNGSKNENAAICDDENQGWELDPVPSQPKALQARCVQDHRWWYLWDHQ